MFAIAVLDLCAVIVHHVEANDDPIHDGHSAATNAGTTTSGATSAESFA